MGEPYDSRVKFYCPNCGKVVLKVPEDLNNDWFCACDAYKTKLVPREKRHIKIYKCQQCICFNSWRNDDGELIYTCNVNGKKIDNPQEIAEHCEEV